MSNLRPSVRTAIRNFVQSQNDSHIPIDVLRVIQEEANLMKETQEICDCLDADPFEELNEIKNQISKLKSQIQVMECSRIRTGFDYCSIDAVVSIIQNNNNNNNNNLQLTFKYERKIDKEDSDHHENNAAGSKKGGSKNSHNNNNGQKIWYSIDISHNYGQRQKLLLIQVFAPNGIPSGEKAVCVTPSSPIQGYDDDDDEGEGSGGWEDIDDDDDNDNDNNNNNIQSREISETTATATTMIRLDNAAESSSEVSQSRKKQKLSSNSSSSSSSSSSQQQDNDGDKETKEEVPAEEEDILHRSKQQKINDTDGADDDDDEANNVGAMIQHITNCDTYSTSIDPEVLHDFLESAGLSPMGEATAFFLLMTFPFYEHEWDLVGFVLQEVFGASPSDDEESSDDDDDDARNEQNK